MNLPISFEQLETYFMVFIRTGAIIFTVPLFGSREFPAIAKIGLTATVAWVVFPMVTVPEAMRSLKLLQLAPAIFNEILIGIIIGFVARIFFEGVQLGGQLVGFQMWFGIVKVIDPVTGANFSIIAQTQNLLATLIFISLNMHHWFFKAIALSFEKLPLMCSQAGGPLWEWIISLSGSMFVIAVKVMAPVIATLLLATTAMGIIAKGIQGINVFIVMFPLKIAIGLFVAGLSLPMFSIVLGRIFAQLEGYILTVFSLSS